jgi:hypothetical protein
MLIQHGEVVKLGSRPWLGVELTSETRIEEAVLHIGIWAAEVFKAEPFQLFFPVQKRDLGGVTLLTPFLMVRTLDLKDLKKISAVFGVQGVECDDRGKIIELENSFVQQVRERAEKIHDSWSDGIVVGSFVRLLMGSGRMLCGIVERLNHTTARVRVELVSRNVIFYCPVRMLLNLGEVPKEKQSYFYIPGLW